jgi:hypothetical protein
MTFFPLPCVCGHSAAQHGSLLAPYPCDLCDCEKWRGA